MMALTILLVGFLVTLYLWVRVIGLNLSLTSAMLGGLLVLHGPAYLYYTRVWGPGDGLMYALYVERWPQPLNFFEHVTSFANTRSPITELDIALALLLFSLAAGILLAHRLLRCSPAEMRHGIETWNRAPVRALPSSIVAWLAVGLGLCVLAAAMIAWHEDQWSRVVRYFLSQGGEFEKIAMRREMGGSRHYLYNLALSAVLPLLTFWAVVLSRRSPLTLLPVAAALVAAVLLGKLSTLSKAPPAVFCLQLVLLIIIWQRLSVRALHLLLLGGCAVLLFGGMSLVANVGLKGVTDTLLFLFYRIFMIPNESLVEYFSAIPSVLPHTGGGDSRWLAALTGEAPLAPTFSRVADVFRDRAGMSTTNAMFLGDAWAAFSWAGVAATGLLAGVALRTIDIVLIARLGKSAATIAAVTAGWFGVFVALSTAFQTALLTGGLLLLIPFAWLYSKLEADAKR